MDHCVFEYPKYARMYLQLPLRQWDAGNVYLLVLSIWKVNIVENPIAVMGLYIHSGVVIYFISTIWWDIILHMMIPDPYGTTFCAELVVALDFDLIFKSCSTYCDKFECHAAPLALSCICHFTENDIFIGNHKGSSCCTPKPLPDNLHTIEPNSFCCQIHVLVQARFHDILY